MKIIIAGGREYTFTMDDYARLDAMQSKWRFTEVVSGAARGADECGESWARSQRLPVKRFPAEWDKYGGGAGPLRNRQMAEYADAVALFPGGAGTENMHRNARLAGLAVFDFRPVVGRV